MNYYAKKSINCVINNKSLLMYRHMCMPVWKAHKCRIEKPSNSFSPSFNITIVTNKQKIQLVHLEKDQYALIQSLFFDRKDELEQMQKVLWSIVDNEKNQLNPDIQVKAIEQLHIVSDKLVHLYHSLSSEVEFGVRRHFFINNDRILTEEQQRKLDSMQESLYRVQYKNDFAEMKKSYYHVVKLGCYDGCDYIVTGETEEVMRSAAVTTPLNRNKKS
jgi:hypothetical protein